MKKRIFWVVGLVICLAIFMMVYIFYIKDRTDSTAIPSSSEEIIAEPEEKEVELVRYEGPVHHIFFHSLIVYPELAFDNDGQAKGYDMWMTTVGEFERMLPQLRDRGYVLYDIEELTKVDENGNAELKAIYLPRGKKPLILSIDDVSYYEYMKNDGFAKKIVFDETGEIANEVVTPDGNTIITRKGDVMPILEDFIKENPDFSFNGARGVIALTGYQGVFGYRITDLKGEELNKALKDATDIANKLKETGWRFASHSYTHNQYFKDMTITMKQIKYDNERWKKYVEPILGKTNIYISPFGVRFKSSEDERYRYLVEEGFNIYCPVYRNPNIYLNRDNIIMNRINLDGYMMRNGKEYLNNTYFNVDEVLDKARP